MTQLRAWGYAEAELRRHSPAWMNGQLRELANRRRIELADSAMMTSMAVAAAFDEDAHEALVNVTIEMLAVAGDEAAQDSSSDAWLLNPDAKTDIDAFHAAVGEAQGPDIEKRLSTMSIHRVKKEDPQP